jgi:hypothetical protein
LGYFRADGCPECENGPGECRSRFLAFEVLSA